MALALKSAFFRAQIRGQTLSHRNPSLISPSIVRLKSSTVMASLEVAQTRSISQTFSKLKEQGKVALIPFITAGDPDLATTSKALKILDTCGSDLIELGMPYSDPLADGPVIQAAATRALAKGANFDSVISMLRESELEKEEVHGGTWSALLSPSSGLVDSSSSIGAKPRIVI